MRHSKLTSNTSILVNFAHFILFHIIQSKELRFYFLTRIRTICLLFIGSNMSPSTIQEVFNHKVIATPATYTAILLLDFQVFHDGRFK